MINTIQCLNYNFRCNFIRNVLYFGTHFNVFVAPQGIVGSLEQKINEMHKLSEGRLKQAQEAESMVIELKTAKQRCSLLFISILRVWLCLNKGVIYCLAIITCIFSDHPKPFQF